MKLKKLLIMSALLAAGVVQADNNWINVSGDNDWNNVANWKDGVLPGAGQAVIIDRYYDSTFQLPSDPPDTDAGGLPTLDSSATAGAVFIGLWATTSGPSQIGELTMVNGAALTMDNLLMGRDNVNNTGILTMSGNATLITGGLFFPQTGGTASLSLSDTASITINNGFVDANTTDWSVVLDGDATFTAAGADAAWADVRITALNAGGGESIQVTDVGGKLEYSVIPEPATLGMVALMGGGILWIRKRFMI